MMRRLLKWVGAIVIIVTLVIAGLILLNRTPDSEPAAMRAKYGGAPSRFVDLGHGLTVHLRDEGPRDAPAIVLLHGSNADLHTWDPWVRDLSRDYRVVRFDQIGHGLTGPAPDRDYSPAAFVTGVDAVADKLGLDRFVLAGNSMGGGVALNYALAHPQRLRGLVLIDAAGAPPLGKPKGNLGFTIARNPLLRSLLGRVTPRRLVEKSLRQTVANQEIVTPAMVDRYWELLRYPGNRDATYARFSQPRRSVAPAALAKLDVPTLIEWGERDPLISIEAGRWFHRAIPNSTLVVYRGIGHIPMEEAAQRSVADLRKWLGALPPPPDLRERRRP